MNWLSILVGRACTGKTTLVRLLSQLTNKRLVEFSVNNATDTSDLLGGFEKITHLKTSLQRLDRIVRASYMQRVLQQRQPSRDQSQLASSLHSYFDYVFSSTALFKTLLSLDDQVDADVAKFIGLFETNLRQLQRLDAISRETHVTASRLLDALRSSAGEGRSDAQVKFAWIESSLVKAIESGDWVLIDNANFCAASVLDRLNPLLETGGSLHISERSGAGAVVRPHKDFRVFLSVNESFGELSRPMRNRGVEIYLSELDAVDDQQDARLMLHNRFHFGETSKEVELLYEKMVEVDGRRRVSRGKKLAFADMLKWAKLTYDFWLIDEPDMVRSEEFLVKCFGRTLQELRLQEEKMEMDDQTIATVLGTFLIFFLNFFLFTL